MRAVNGSLGHSPNRWYGVSENPRWARAFEHRPGCPWGEVGTWEKTMSEDRWHSRGFHLAASGNYSWISTDNGSRNLLIVRWLDYFPAESACSLSHVTALLKRFRFDGLSNRSKGLFGLPPRSFSLRSIPGILFSLSRNSLSTVRSSIQDFVLKYMNRIVMRPSDRITNTRASDPS